MRTRTLCRKKNPGMEKKTRIEVNTMNFTRFFSIQKGLDDTILKEKEITIPPDKINKIVALLVEIGEMANETRCFKYWSNKEPSKKKVILEEYVDCMHFLLGIGNDYGFSR